MATDAEKKIKCAPVNFFGGDELQHCFENVPNDPLTSVRPAQLEAEHYSAENFNTFAHSLCSQYRRAWRSTRRMLSQHLNAPTAADATQEETQPGEPSDVDICCYFARLQPIQARATKWYAQALQADPRCVPALLAVADEHRRAERFGEAGRLYKQALQQVGKLPERVLYRLGEVLVQSGRGAEGRQYLRRLLKASDATCGYHVHAATTMALSYAVDQRHDRALQCCREAEELQQHSSSGARRTCSASREIRLVLMLRGLTQLRMGDLDAAIQTLKSVTGEARAGGPSGRSAGEQVSWHCDEIVQSLLCYAETKQGNYVEAERHLESARQLAAGSSPGADMLVSGACLRQAQGNPEAAKVLLQQALQVDRNCPAALLRMGYLLLCQGHCEKAVQYLQKCLQQPSGTLAYGAAQKGAAHLYLCLAYHSRAAEAGRSGAGSQKSKDKTDSERLAQNHFRRSCEMQPDLCQAVAAIAGTYCFEVEAVETAAALLVAGNPRMGMLDLTVQQAGVVLFYAKECSVIQVSQRQPSCCLDQAQTAIPPFDKDMGTSPRAASLCVATEDASEIQRTSLASLSSTMAMTPSAPPASVCTATLASPEASKAAAEQLALEAVTAVGCNGGPASLASTLGATVSTATPTSASSSRHAVELLPFPDTAGPGEETATELEDLKDRLQHERVLHWGEVELGECVSCGEFAVVHRGKLRSSQCQVVVKMMHQRCSICDGPAARDLLAEIRILAGLSHPRVVELVGACLETGHLAILTELAPGGNLHQALHVRHRPFSTSERFQLAMDLLEGVRFLHLQRPVIAHFDLKSTNLVLDAEGRRLRICDFGLARALREGQEEWEVKDSDEPPPSRGGSPRYMAPECYDSKFGPLTEMADVWSCGCILIEVFGSCLPYAECSNVQQILKNMLMHRCGPSIPATIEVNVRGAIAFTFVFEVKERLAVGQVLVLLKTAASNTEGRACLACAGRLRTNQ